MSSTLYYFHDPMCSWCWGYKPTWEALQASLPPSVQVEYIVGGLAPDSDQPMPESMANAIRSYWQKIEDELGAPFNYDFWTVCTPRRSTYPACRAVLAAKQQNKERTMINGIQEAYYLQAMNPSDTSTLISVAESIGANVDQFKQDLGSKEVQSALESQIKMALHYQVPGFPSLLLQVDDSLHHITINYKNPETTLKQITALCA